MLPGKLTESVTRFYPARKLNSDFRHTYWGLFFSQSVFLFLNFWLIFQAVRRVHSRTKGGERKKKHVARGRGDLSNYWHTGKKLASAPAHQSGHLRWKKTENLPDSNKGKWSNRCMLRIPAFAARAQVNTSHDGETFLYFRALTLLSVHLRALGPQSSVPASQFVLKIDA